MEAIITQLIQFGEPSIRYKVRTGVLEEQTTDPLIRALQMTIKRSPRVQTLLAERDERGYLPHHPYRKWLGAHWVLADLADLGYPPGDEDLVGLREQVYDWLLSRGHGRNIVSLSGRTRRCASQEGNAVHYLYSLGLADERTEELARRLRGWQWPDGGWNCDRRPEATHSSYHETLIPLRALGLHARQTGDRESLQAVEHAAEVLLKRSLYRRLSDGSIIDPAFVKLHYPYYWRYNILYALRVMAELGKIGDPRCADALDVVEAKRLTDGGFPAETKYYRAHRGGDLRSGHSQVDWGGTSEQRMNPWVTVEALSVLAAAGRLC